MHIREVSHFIRSVVQQPTWYCCLGKELIAQIYHCLGRLVSCLFEKNYGISHLVA